MQDTLKRKLLAGGIAGALVLGVGAVAGAAVGTGALGSNDSGFDSARDIAERGTGVTTPDSTPVSTPGSLPADETRVDGDRTETRQFVDLTDGTESTFAAGPAGSVTIARDGSSLRIVRVDPAAGWTIVKTETETGEVQVRLVSGGVTVRIDAEFEDGAIRIRVRQRGTVTAASTPDVTTPTLGSSGDDHSGPGSGFDDSSGPGSGSSGSGSSGSGSGHSGGDDDSGHSGSGGSEDSSGHGGGDD